MGPDWSWVAVFCLGGVAIGLYTSLVGTPKGAELYAWLAHYLFVACAVAALGLPNPFINVLAASLAAGFSAAIVQTVFMDAYGKHNDWYDPSGGPPIREASHFMMFGIAAATVLGVMMASLAWGLSALSLL